MILRNFLCLHGITLNIIRQYRIKINLLLLSKVTPGVAIYTNILISHFFIRFYFFLVGDGYSILFYFFKQWLAILVYFILATCSISWLLKTTWSFFKLWLLVINVTNHGISGLLWLLVINVTNHGIKGLCLSFNKYILTLMFIKKKKKEYILTSSSL